MNQTTILVADALPLFAEALATSLRLESDFLVFSEYPANGPGTVEAAIRLRPEVAIIDYWMPDMEGPIITESIHSQLPKCKMILTSWIFGPPQIEAAINAGVAWFLPKDTTLGYVTEAIRRAKAGEDSGSENEEYLREVLQTRQGLASNDLESFQRLTPREIEILTLLNAGQTINQLSKRLSVSPKTARNHISQILHKTSTQSQIEAVAKARSCGFLRI